MKYIQKYLELLNVSKEMLGGNDLTKEAGEFHKYEKVKWMNHPYTWHLSNNSFYRNQVILKLIKLEPKQILKIFRVNSPGLTDDQKDAKSVEFYRTFIGCILLEIPNIETTRDKISYPGIKNILLNYRAEYNKYLLPFEQHNFLATLTIDERDKHFVFVTKLIEYFRETYLKIKELLDVSPEQDAITASLIKNHFYAFECLWITWKDNLNKFYGITDGSPTVEDPNSVWAHIKKPETLNMINQEYSMLTESSVISYIKVRADRDESNRPGEKPYNEYFNIYLENQRTDEKGNKPRALLLTGPNPNKKIPLSRKLTRIRDGQTEYVPLGIKFITGPFSLQRNKDNTAIDALTYQDLNDIISDPEFNEIFPKYMRDNISNLKENRASLQAEQITQLEKQIAEDCKTIIKNSKNLEFKEDGSYIGYKKTDYAYLYGPFTEVFLPSDNNLKVAQKCTHIKEKLNKNENVFVLGYGASGAGKTSGLIYFKQGFKDAITDEKKGILLNLIEDPELRPNKRDIDEVIVTVQELYAEELTKDVNKNETPVIKTKQLLDFKFKKTADGFTFHNDMNGRNSGKDFSDKVINKKAGFQDKDYPLISYVRKPIDISRGDLLRREARAIWTRSVKDTLKTLHPYSGAIQTSWSSFIDGLFSRVITVTTKPDRTTETTIDTNLLDIILPQIPKPNDENFKIEYNKIILQMGDKLYTKFEVPTLGVQSGPIFNEEVLTNYEKYVGDIEWGNIEAHWKIENNVFTINDTRAKCLQLSSGKFEDPGCTKDGDPIKIKNMGEFIFTVVDTIRMISPTPNNPASSRSHVLIYLNINGVYLIFGDLAGVENRFTCENIETQIDFLNLKKINPRTNNPNKYDLTTGKELNDDDEKGVTVPNYSYISKANFHDLGSQEYAKYQKYLKKIGYDYKQKTIPKTTVDNLATIYDYLTVATYKNNFPTRFDWPIIKNLFDAPVVDPLIEYINSIPELKDYDFSTLSERQITTRNYFTKVNYRATQIKQWREKNYTLNDPFYLLAKKINPRLNLNIGEEDSGILTNDPSNANKEIVVDIILRRNINQLRESEKEKLKILDFIQNGIIQDRAMFDIVKTKITDKLRGTNGYIDKILDSTEEITEETKNIINDIWTKLGENNSIVQSSRVKEFCKRRESEGVFINRALEGMRVDMQNIVRRLSKKSNNSLISGLPLVKEPCFKYFCNQDHAYCYTQIKKQSTGVNTIINSISGILQKDPSEIELNFVIFGVINLSNLNFKDDPPRLPYFDLLKIKKARDIYLTYQYYGQESINRTTFLDVISKEFTGYEFASKETGVKTPKYGSILHTATFFRDYIDSLLPNLTSAFNNIKNDVNLLRTTTDFIQQIDNINALSIIGTIDFMNELKNVFLTDINCSMFTENDDGVLVKEINLKEENVTNYRNVVIDNTLASVLGNQKQPTMKSLSEIKLLETQGNGHGFLTEGEPPAGPGGPGGPGRVGLMTEYSPVSPKIELVDVIKGGSYNEKEKLIKEYKQLKKLYKKLNK